MSTNGCELCGGFPSVLRSKCHPTAPLMAEMIEPEILILKCYLPECGREVARLKLSDPRELAKFQSERLKGY